MKLKKTLIEIFKRFTKQRIILLGTVIFAVALTILLIFWVLKRNINKNEVDLFNQVTDSSIVVGEFNNQQVELEVAKSYSKRGFGLMFRNSLEDNKGMIFVFNNEDYRSFYMKNTYISLDIIFLDKDLKIVSISNNTKINQTNELYYSKKPAKYVIELPANFSENYNLNTNTYFKVTKVTQ